jgi:hypothetical protein
MAATQAMCTSFKVEILNGIHAFGTTVVRGATTADVFKIALYTSSSTMGAATTVYSTTNEITNTAGTAYVAAGNTLTNVAPTSTGTTAFTDFADTSWTTASFTANSALIYNFTQGGASGKAVAVLAFGADKTSTAGTFTIIFPAADATNAVIRIA